MTSIASFASARVATQFALSDLEKLTERTQLRLSSGNRMNSVTDDAVAFFRARTLQTEAKAFAGDETLIKEAQSLAELSEAAVGQIEALIEQALNAVAITDATTSLNSRKIIASQIQNIINESSLGGQNILGTTNATFSLQSGTLTVTALDIPTAIGDTSTANITNTSSGFLTYTTTTLIQARLDNVRYKLSEVQTAQTALAARATFETSRNSVFETAAANITGADLTEESANLAAYQTQQNLALQAISLSNQQVRKFIVLLEK